MPTEEDDGLDQHVKSLKTEDREEEEVLMGGNEASHPTPRAGLVRSKGQDRDIDVWVKVEIIGVAMVSVVVVCPPGATDASERLPKNSAAMVFREAERAS
jgi:hypothetical protein